MASPNITEAQLRDHLLSRQREKLLQTFKDNRETELRIWREHVWGGSSFETYKKCSVTLNKKQDQENQNQETLDFITNQNLTHDTTLIWRTTGASVKRALRMGQLNPQALTSKAIKAIGKYNRKCAERTIKSRIQSILHLEKEGLVKNAQDQIENLQKIELRLGQRIYSDSASQSAGLLIQALEEYISRQSKNLPDEKEQEETPFHQTRSQSIKTLAAENQAAAEKLKGLIETHQEDAEWLRANVDQEILSFLKDRIIAATREMQAMNQVLTHQQGSKAYLRGDLNSFAEDTIKVVRDHSQDLHNPVMRDHQLSYEEEEPVIVDSEFHTDSSLEELDELLLIVSEVSENNKSLDDKKGKVKQTSATKWRHLHGFFDPTNPYEPTLFSSWPHFKGSLWNVLLSPLNLIEVMVRGNKANIVSGWRYEASDSEDLKENNNYFALKAHLKKQEDLSTRIGLELYKTFNYLLVEGLWRGLQDGWKQIKRLPDDLSVDFQNSETKLFNVIVDLDKELEKIQEIEENFVSTEKIEQSAAIPANSEPAENKGFSDESGPLPNDLSGSLGEAPDSTSPIPSASGELAGIAEESKEDEEKKEEKPRYRYAQPEVPLMPYASHGILNGAVTGFSEFVDLFGHNMFAKHPFTATVSLAGSAVSFMAFFATPLSVQLFGKGYVKFLLDQGYIWSKEQISASLAGSFTHFKLIGAVIEGIEHGPDSWLSRSAGHFYHDPAKVITFVTLAWGLGHTLVYLVNVPWLSAELRDHIGNPPFLSEIFGGAKLGVIGYHLLSCPQHQSEEFRKNYIDQCLQNYRQSQETQEKSVSEEREKEIRDFLENAISLKKIKELRDQINSKVQDAPEEQEERTLALMLMLRLASQKEKLRYLSPSLKGKLQYQLEKLTSCKEDATAIDHYIDPEHYAVRSALRRFLGGAISYVPTIFRCLLSPFAGLATGSFAAMARPWKNLGMMLLDDITSTVHAVSRFVNKVLETVFNRLPRTLADILVNGLIARTASFFGFHGLTLSGYRISAAYDAAQENLYANTTGKIMNYLIQKDTSPNPELSLQYVLDEKVRSNFSNDSQPSVPEKLGLDQSESDAELEADDALSSQLSQSQRKAL